MAFQGRRLGDPRNKTIAAAVTAAEREQVNAALDAAGFRCSAEGVRSVLLAFAEGAHVRAAVAITRGDMERRAAPDRRQEQVA